MRFHLFGKLEMAIIIMLLEKIKSPIRKAFSVPYGLLRYVKVYFSGFFSSRPIFEKIYYENLWGSSESRSGPGSAIEQTNEIRRELSGLVKELGAKSFLDIPCGDFNWLKEANLDVDYIGADIVNDLIDENTRKYGSSRKRFIKLDMTQDNLPKVDIVFCRDVLVHFNNRQIFQAISKIKNSNSKYLLTTTFPAVDKNINIATGQWRALDLCKSPFNFPKPILIISEHCSESNILAESKCLGLWKVSDL